MLTLRLLRPSNLIRQINFSITLKTKTNHKMKQVHKEIMKYIDPFANIKIQSDIFLKVRSADVHRYPNADVMVAEIHGGHSKNCNIEVSITSKENEKEIDVKIGKPGNEDDFHCVLAVPVKAALNIESKNAVFIEQMQGEKLQVIATQNIKTRDIRSELVSLESKCGQIICAGTLLGQKTSLETKQKNCILLDKLQGDILNCKTEAGDVNVSCCYVEDSTFETETGCMDLKNVHKRAKIIVSKPEGALHMTGVHGNLQIQSNAHILNLQLSELQGENLIVSGNAKKVTINISEAIEQSTELDITAERIALDSTLNYLNDNLDQQKQRLQHIPKPSDPISQRLPSKLTVRSSNGDLSLGKLSWSEMMSKAFDKKPGP